MRELIFTTRIRAKKRAVARNKRSGRLGGSSIAGICGEAVGFSGHRVRGMGL